MKKLLSLTLVVGLVATLSGPTAASGGVNAPLTIEPRAYVTVYCPRHSFVGLPFTTVGSGKALPRHNRGTRWMRWVLVQDDETATAQVHISKDRQRFRIYAWAQPVRWRGC